MELGSVTLKRIGFFCFPIKHSTHKHTSYSILTDFHTSMLGMVGLGKKNLSAVRGAPAFGPGLPSVCVFIIAGPMMIKLFAGGGGGEWRTCAMRDDKPRPVWMSPLITH
jgi:hypothetical protein